MNKNKKFVAGLSALVVLGMTGCGKDPTTYSIVFNTNGGSAISSLEVEWGKEVSMPENPIKTGYTFTGWYNDANLSSQYDTSTKVESAFTLYAGWAINSYTVSFAGDAINIDPKVLNYGSNIDVDAPARDYYVFAGWYTDAEFQNKSNGKVPANDITLYAKWTPNSYTISYNANAPQGTTVSGNMNASLLYETTESKKLPNCGYSIAGYEFKGWALTPDGEVAFENGAVIADHFAETKTIVLYAVWQITDVNVTFHSLGSNGLFVVRDGDDLGKCKFGDAVTAPATNPTLNEYEFGGWGRMRQTTDRVAVGGKVYYQIQSGSTYQREDNIHEGDDISERTLYEVKAIDFENETVGKDGDYFSLFTRKAHTVKFLTTTDEEILVINGYQDENYDLPVAPVGVTYSNWFTDKALTTRFNSEKVKVNGEMVLYTAKTLKQYNLNLHIQGSSTTSKIVAYTTELNEIFEEINNGLGEEQQIRTWYTDEAMLEKFTGETMPASDLDLYSKIEQRLYKVIFHVDGGNEVEPLELVKNAVVDLPPATKTGHSFKGWFADEECTIPASIETMPTHDVDLYAKFEVNNYIINYTLDGITTKNVSVPYGANLADYQPRPERKNCIFQHWINVDTQEVFKFEGTMPDKQINVKAVYQYAPVEVTINFKFSKIDDQTIFEDGAQESEKLFGTIDSVFDVKANDLPQIEGFTFDHIDSLVVKEEESLNVVNAYYVRKQFRVNFIDAENGNTLLASKEVAYKGAVGEIPAGVAKAGKITTYKIGQNIGQDVSDFVVEGLTNIYVYYTDASGLIIHGNGGKFGDKATYTSEIAQGNPIALPEEPTRDGYDFIGYTESESDATGAFKSTADVMGAEGLTLYAHWTAKNYDLTFANTGDSTINKITAAYGSDVTLPTEVEKAGYTFVGWKLNGSLIDSATLKMPIDGAELEAEWKANQIVITFNANGGVGTMAQQTIKFDDASRVVKTNAYEKDLYDFAGWSTKTTGDAEFAANHEFEDSDFSEESKSITLYAVWNVGAHTVTFKNGDDVVDTLTANNFELLEGVNQALVKEGYTFVGWYKVDGLGEITNEKVYFDEPLNESLTVKAKFVKNSYNVIFNTNGGAPVSESDNHLFESTLDGYELPTPAARTGFAFDGWYTKDGSDGGQWGQKIDAAYLSNFTFGASDVVFHAKWTPIYHRVTVWAYYNNQGTVEYTSKEIQVQEGLPFTIDNPINNGNETFVGWYDAKTGGTFVNIQELTVSNDNLAIYAQYVEEKYKYIFKDETGKTIFEVYSDEADPTFMAYINSLLNELNGYQNIYESIQKAVGGDTSDITAVLTYATVGGKTTPELIAIATNANGVNEGNTMYAANLLGGIYGQNDAAQVYADILGASVQDGTAIANITAKAGTGDNLYVSIGQALTEAMGGSTEHMQALVTWSTIANNYSRNQLLSMFAVNQGADQTKNPQDVIDYIDANLPYAKYADYYNILAASGASGIETISNVTTANLNNVGSLYQKYEDNAYNPFSSNPNKYFDGWTSTIDTNSKEVEYRATFVEKAKPVTNLVVYSTTSSSATFQWDAVADCYGYRVEVTINGNTESHIVRNNGGESVEYKVTGLKNGDSVSIVVTVLKGENSNTTYKQYSKEFVVNSLKDGQPITLEKVELDSTPISVEYSHKQTADIGAVASSGDFFYKTVKETDEGDVTTIVLFTNCDYTFGGKEITLLSGNELDIKIETGDMPKLITSSKTGTFEVKVGESVVNAIIRPLPTRLSFGEGLGNYMSIQNTDIKMAKDAKFLGTEKEVYQIGTAIKNGTAVGATYGEFTPAGSTDKYTNGFRFDVDVIDSFGSKIEVSEFKKSYNFEKFNGVAYEPVDLSAIGVYDEENDVFYFFPNQTGEYRVVISADTSEGNTFVPKAYKNDNDRINNLTKGVEEKIVFELTEGINVYNAADLRKAYSNKDVSKINIHANISGMQFGNQVSYCQYIKDMNDSTGPVSAYIFNTPVEEAKRFSEGELKIFKDYGRTNIGDVDIVNGTAVMSTSTSAGPLIWKKAAAEEEPTFVAKDGTGYVYSKDNGTHAIETAEWKSNFNEGAFKINAGNGGKVTADTLGKIHEESAQLFRRVGEVNEELIVNGNYFTVDASESPCLRSESKNTAGSVLATYEIQSHQAAVFLNGSNKPVTFNSLNVVGNTENNSGAVDSGKQDVAKAMEYASGGMNGIRTANSNGEAYTSKTILNHVNVNNCTIDVYSDDNCDCHYVHTSNAWANGVYGVPGPHGGTINIDHSIIETSGGAATQYDDYYAPEKGSNPTINIDFATTTIENFVCGDEQWFKAYSMEVTALGLKSMVNAPLESAGMTILKEMKNPVTGITGEYMNWVDFAQLGGTAKEASFTDQSANPSQYGTNVGLSPDYISLNGTSVFVQVDANNQPVLDGDGNANVCVIVNATTQQPFTVAQYSSAAIPLAGDAQYLITYTKVALASLLAGGETATNAVGAAALYNAEKQFIYFRMQYTGFGYIAGILEVFKL